MPDVGRATVPSVRSSSGPARPPASVSVPAPALRRRPVPVSVCFTVAATPSGTVSVPPAAATRTSSTPRR